MSSNMLRSIVSRSLIAAIICVLVGFLVYEGQVVNIRLATFQFVSTGVIGSTFFFTYRFGGIRPAFVLLLISFFLMTGLLTHGYRNHVLDRDAFYIGGIGATMYLFGSRIYKQGNRLQWLSPIILGGLLGAFMLIITCLLVLIKGAPDNISFFGYMLRSWPIAGMEFMIGLGLGLGIVVTEFFAIGKSDAEADTGQPTPLQ